MKWFLGILTLILIVLHNDFWNWAKTDPRVFGYLPVGIWYHAGYCIAASVLLWLCVLLAWPKHLEDAQPEEGVAQDRTPTH